MSLVCALAICRRSGDHHHDGVVASRLIRQLPHFAITEDVLRVGTSRWDG
jgi:hypothetical protein